VLLLLLLLLQGTMSHMDTEGLLHAWHPMYTAWRNICSALCVAKLVRSLLLLLWLLLLQGTMSHMAPEALLHGRISKAGDVYAFGISLWELFTGGKAYQGAAAASRHMHVSACAARSFPLLVQQHLCVRLFSCCGAIHWRPGVPR
jgi:hypothetical protein